VRRLYGAGRANEGMLPSVPARCWPLDAASAMTDNFQESRHRGSPLGTGQAGEERTIDGLRREIEELRGSRTRLARAAHAERRGIERALHEGVQQDLVGLAAHLEIVASWLDSDPGAAKTLVGELQREARRVLTETQALANRIFPPLLEAGGLIPELRAAAARSDVPARIAVEVGASCPTEIAAAIYFCALDVFLRAPAGTPVGVSVRGEGGTLAFEVTADCDLGPERLAPHDHIEALGGAVTITSAGERTTVAGSLPLSG